MQMYINTTIVVSYQILINLLEVYNGPNFKLQSQQFGLIDVGPIHKKENVGSYFDIFQNWLNKIRAYLSCHPLCTN